MNLILHNLGKLHEETCIKFDGITVLAGQNGSGKSTVSKALYCMFHGLYNIEQRIYHDRALEIANIITRSIVSNNNSRRNGKALFFAEQLMEKYGHNQNLRNLANGLEESRLPFSSGTKVEELAGLVEQVLLISDEEMQKQLLFRVLQNKFDGCIANVNYPEEMCSIKLIIKDKELSVNISPDGKLELSKAVELSHDAIYIDDSFGTESLFGRYGLYNSLGDDFNPLLSANNLIYDGEENTAVGELLNEKKYSEIFALLESAGIGALHRDDFGKWRYSAKNLRKPIGVENISSGTKTFLALKYLLEKDKIDREDVLILDEPEVNLHPRWQERYAEIITLLQKTFDLTLLISTHSADFVSFLEYYSMKQNISHNCHFYLMSDEAGGASAMVEDVTDCIDMIYKELSVPYLNIIEKLNREKYD